MWGFFKCNYSYTKILIVLLFSLSHLFFFFQGRVIPECGPAQAAPWAEEGIPGRLWGVWAAAGGSGHAPSPLPANLPTASHHRNNATPKARSQCGPYVGSLGPRLSVYGTGTQEGFGVGNLEPAWYGSQRWGSGLGYLPTLFPSAPLPDLELQPDWFLKLVILTTPHQQLRICLPMQGTQVWSLVRERGSHMPWGNWDHAPQWERRPRLWQQRPSGAKTKIIIT